MISVFELGYRYLLPSIKKMLAEELSRRGLSRVEVSKLLGISPSTVTRYVLGERGNILDLGIFRDVREEVSKLADKTSKKMLDRYGLNLEIAKIAIYVLARGYICRFHSELDLEVEFGKCNICKTLFINVPTSSYDTPM